MLHDGLMVEKKDINLDFLNECNEFIFNETGYKVKVVEKEMVQDESLVEGDVESYEK
jgi:hypothetical protein